MTGWQIAQFCVGLALLVLVVLALIARTRWPRRRTGRTVVTLSDPRDVRHWELGMKGPDGSTLVVIDRTKGTLEFEP